jgi:hypothetical protein
MNSRARSRAKRGPRLASALSVLSLSNLRFLPMQQAKRKAWKERAMLTDCSVAVFIAPRFVPRASY